MRSKIVWSAGYKYQLERDAFFDTPLRPKSEIVTEYITLLPCGQLILRKGYAWNGPNFPAVHTRRSIIASLPHDGLYQLIELGLLSDNDRRNCDVVLENIMAEPFQDEGLLLGILRRIRASYYYAGVDLFGKKYAHSKTVIYTVE